MDSDEGSLPSPPGPPKEPPPSLPPPLPARPIKQEVQPEQPKEIDKKTVFDPEVDADEEISHAMTASYSEISFKSGLSPENETEVSLSLSLDPVPLADQILQRPATLSCEKSSSSKSVRPLNLEGTVHVEGNMTHFVTEDLEYKIKLSSPVSKKDNSPLPGNSKSVTPNTLYRQLMAPQVGHVDAAILNDLEAEAQRMATSVDNLTENLCGILHSISSITADNVGIYKDAVSKMCDSMDANIKSMYTMMAKTEEVTEAMKSVQAHSNKIKEIRRLVDLFESYL